DDIGGQDRLHTFRQLARCRELSYGSGFAHTDPPNWPCSKGSVGHIVELCKSDGTQHGRTAEQVERLLAHTAITNPISPCQSRPLAWRGNHKVPTRRPARNDKEYSRRGKTEKRP